MKLKTLLLSILGIFIFAACAYAVFSPIAKRAELKEYQDLGVSSPLAPESDVDTAVAVPENSLPVVQNPSSSVGGTSTSTLTPAPVPTPTPAPLPQPAPQTPSGYTAAEVAMHASASSCWTIINNEVYDVTSYVSKHPGGSSKILRICGKDGTAAFEGQHGGESRPENTLAKYKIGPLK